ncbi:MAG: hypothetical protein H6838_08490 [Planctomycetes bacterium]|nr:hypothetical protein [Planctomycetota bacterium]MCB9885516.1 hypothetical protein [Planctomycetota bacterium]
MQKLIPAVSLVLAASAAVAQIPCSTTNLGTNLGITDETMSTAQALGFTFTYNNVGYTDIQVCDNGYITLGATGGIANWNVSAATMLGRAFASIRPFWIDLEPGIPGSGDVWFRAVPATATDPAYAVITWDNVLDYNTNTTPCSFQLMLIDGGQIRVHYGANLGQLGASEPWLIGATQGNAAAANPVSFATLPLLTSGNPTLHETGAGPIAYADRTYDWLPDGNGGFIVTENTNCATAVSYGVGCVGTFNSFYEHFTTTPSIDLSNTAFTLLYAAGDYILLPSTSAFVAPSATATNLGLGDDAETTVNLSSALSYPGGTTMSLNVCSNGHISTASNNAQYDYTPTPAEFLNWANATWAVWRDMIPGPTGGGDVWFEEVGNVAYVTWLNVIGYVGTAPGTTPSTFQLQFDLTTGNVDFVFGSMDTVSISGWTGGEGWIVGFSPAGASSDPGSVDLTTAVPATLTLHAVENLPLEISCNNPPIAATTISLDTANIPAGSPFGAVLLGFTQYNPGISLSSIGMDGCFRYNEGAATLLFFPAGSTGSINFTVPNYPGFSIQAQSVVYAPGAGLTTLGALASGGLSLNIN